MDLQNNLVSLGPDGMSFYRRQMGVYFRLLQVAPWQDQGQDAFLRQIFDAFGDDARVDLILDQRFSLYKAVSVAQGAQPLKVMQFDGALTVSGRDTASLAMFTLSLGIDTIGETLQRFAPVHDRIDRLIVRMPSKEFRTFVYLDWRRLVADPSRLDLAVMSESCIFVPRLAAATGTQDHSPSPSIQLPPVPLVVTQASAFAEPVGLTAVSHPPVGAVGAASPQDAPAVVAKSYSDRRTLTLILPLTDDLRTSFLGFGYSVGASSHQARPLEIGAFRRNLRSSYSRLMGGTDVVDLKSQPPAPESIAELKAVLHKSLADGHTTPCFIGSEVLSPEVLEIFRDFAQDADMAINAIVCSAAVPSTESMDLIATGLAAPDLRVQTVCFVAAGEPSGFVDASGRPRGYFGAPPVEGQSMARCMEFRSNVEDPAFIIPASIPSREAHALERFVNAFRPLRDDVEHKPAA